MGNICRGCLDIHDLQMILLWMELEIYFCRYLNFEEEWKNLYEARWPAFGWRSKNFRSQSSARSANQKEVECESANDWQQMYWEAHLQKYEHQMIYLLVVTSYHYFKWLQFTCHFKILHFLRNSCLDTAAELTLFPSFHGRISEIEVPGKRFMLIDVSYHPSHYFLAIIFWQPCPDSSSCILF